MAAESALALSRKAAAHLSERGIENARLDAELMLSAVLGISRLDLYLQFDRPVDEAQLQSFREMVRRRLKREPVQYILGNAHFRKLVLQVDRRVLIPRPETEVLVGAVLDWAKAEGRRGRVLDLGTGSGAIALSLALEGEFERVVATDVSPEALEVARENAGRAGLLERVELRCGSLWEACRPGERFAAIVSNPPYVGVSERPALAPEVAGWEPEQALFAGEDGLDVIRTIAASAARWLEPGGLLALEIGAAQGPQVVELLTASPGLAKPRIVKDLAGRERIALATAILQE